MVNHQLCVVENWGWLRAGSTTRGASNLTQTMRYFMRYDEMAESWSTRRSTTDPKRCALDLIRQQMNKGVDKGESCWSSDSTLTNLQQDHDTNEIR